MIARDETTVSMPVWVFLHLQKSGGTTIFVHAARNLTFDDQFISMSPWGNKYRQKHSLFPFESRSINARKRARVIAGHRTYYGLKHFTPSSDVRFFTGES